MASEEPDGDGEDREPIDLSADVDGDVGGESDGDAESDVETGIDADELNEADSSEPFAALEAGEDVDEPFAELDADAREALRDSPREFPDEELAAAAGDADAEADPFEEMEVTDLDEEEVWAALSAGEEAEVDLAGEATPVEGEEGVEDHIVDKREYCQQCPYFTEPPTVSCSHEGTEIVEVTSADEFRVRGCPMVAEEGPTFKRE